MLYWIPAFAGMTVGGGNLVLERFAGVGPVEGRIDPKWQQVAVPGVARK